MDGDLGVGAGGVLVHVGQGLLDHAVHRAADGGGDDVGVAVFGEGHLESGRGGVGDQVGQAVGQDVRDAGGAAGAQDAHEVAELGQRLAARGPELFRALADLVVLGGHLHRAGVQDHEVQAVGDDVVHLRREPDAFVGSGLFGEEIAFGSFRAVDELVAGGQVEAGEQDDRERAQARDGVAQVGGGERVESDFRFGQREAAQDLRCRGEQHQRDFPGPLHAGDDTAG